MKTLKLTSIIMLAMIVFSSCQSEESLNLEDTNAEALLKGYELQRNSDGTYFLDYKTKGSSDITFDKKKSESNINLFESNVGTSKNTKEILGDISGIEQVKINFNDTKLDKTTSITVKDEDISFAREDNELLDSFNFESKGDGVFDLDFTVKENVVVDFVYNDEYQSYDILLSEGTSSDSNFLRTFNADADGNLKIAFVTSSNATSRVLERKPEVIVGQGGDGNTGG